jgi:NAD(P)-dependent dehydrogenase (short-subunit alcohol dehydrogenase family)
LNIDSFLPYTHIFQIQEIEGVASNETAVMAIPIDLLSFKSVKQAAEKINKIAKEHGGLDVLCCNAGIMAMNDDRTEDGYDVQIQVCHLSHALLTQKCMVSLEEAAATRGEARVVYQSCPTRYGLRDLDAKYFEKCEPMTLGGNNYNAAFMRYHMAKLANSTFAMALHIALQEKGSKVKSIGSDPGQATTNLQQTSTHMTGFILRLLNVGGRLGFSQSPADGSMSATVACFGKNIYSGDFIMPTGKTGLAGYPIKSIAMNLPIKNGWEKETLKEGNQKLIWEVTEKELGVLFDLQPETINHHQRSSETKSALLV